MDAGNKHKIVVITGASSGIGEACASVYAKAGYKLALGARREDRLTALAAKLRTLGASDVLHGHLDVRDEASVSHFADSVGHRFGPPDILINNAGLASGVDAVASGKEEQWRAMIDTNVYGFLLVTRRFLRDMLNAGHGHIVNLGSIASFQTYANGAVYAATKHAVRAVSGALRLELNDTPIRVSEIDPGMVETEFSLVRLADQAKADAVYEGMTPLSPHDIAECIYFMTTRPPHVNVDHMIVMPTDQASVYKVHRQPK